jgi:hypothetical protein
VGFTEYLVGIAYLTLTVAALGLVGVSLRQRLLGSWQGPPARLAEVIFAISALIVAAEMLGSFGGLTPAALLLVLLIVAAMVWALCRGSAVDPDGNEPPPAPSPQRWLIVLALIVAAVATFHWANGVQDSLDFGIYRQDSAWYHLPLSAGIFQTGDTWAVRFTDPMALTAWFYPQNSELLHAVGMLAFGNDFLSPFVNIGWMALALLAAWCVGRPFGRGPETLIATALVLGTAMMQVQAGNAPNDTAGVFLLLATIAILVNGRAAGRAAGNQPEYSVGVLLAASLAAGLAIGTKITLLAPVAVITVGLAWILGWSRPRLILTWICGVLAGGGYWYLRNLVHSGNPLPWIEAGPLPGPDQVSLYPRPPHSVADYATDPGIWWHQFAPMLNSAIGPAWPLVLAAAAAGMILATVRGPNLHRVLGLAGIAAVIAYVFVPVSASGTASHPSGFETNLRYLAPALAVGLVLLPLQLNRSGRVRLLAPALAAAFAIDAVSSSAWQPDGLEVGLVLTLLLVATPLAIASLSRRGSARFAAVTAALILAIVALGYPSQRDYLRARYQPALAPAADNPGFRDTPQWRRLQGWARHIHGASIGLSGPPAAFGQYVFYDSELTNQVQYVGEPGSHGSYRPIDDCVSWRRAVDRHRFRFLVLTPASPGGPSAVTQESLWTEGDPHVEEVLRAAPATIYRIDGPLDPGACLTGNLPPVIAVPGGGYAVPSTHLGLPPLPGRRRFPAGGVP